MTEYIVRMIVEGRTTQVHIYANDACAAARLALEEYKGCDAHVISTNKVH